MADLNTNIILSLLDRTGAGTASANRNLASLESGFARLRNTMIGFAGFQFARSLISETIQLTDTYKNLSGRLNIILEDSQKVAQAQQLLFDVAQRTRTSYTSALSIFERVAKSYKDTGKNALDAIPITETVAKTIALSGASGASAEAGLMQFGQALGSGVLQGEELNSVLEQLPALAQAIAAGLGKQVGELKKLASTGAISSETIIRALESQADSVSAKFAQLPVTISQAITTIENAWTRYLGNMDSVKGSTSSLAESLQWVGQHLDGIINLAEAFARVWVASFSIRAVKGVFDFVNAQMKARTAMIQRMEIELEHMRLAVRAEQAETDVALATLRTAQATETAIKALIAHLRASGATISNSAALRTANMNLAASQYAVMTATNAYNAALLKSSVAWRQFAEMQNSAARASSIFTTIWNNFKGFSGIFNLYVIYEIAKAIWEWANSFEGVQIAMTFVYETAKRLGVILTWLFTGQFLTSTRTLKDRLDKVAQDYGDQRDEIKKAFSEENKAAEENARKLKEVEDAKIAKLQASAKELREVTGVIADYYANQKDLVTKNYEAQIKAADAGYKLKEQAEAQ